MERKGRNEILLLGGGGDPLAAAPVATDLPRPSCGADEDSGVTPPSDLTVYSRPQPIIWLADGKRALVRRIGF